MEVEGGKVVPGVAMIRLLLNAVGEGLQRALPLAQLEAAVAQRKPAKWMQRVYGQSGLPVTSCLWSPAGAPHPFASDGVTDSG